MDEFDVLKQNLPLKDNINKYLLIKTKVNYPDDWEFRVATGLDSIINKFGPSAYKEMRPIIVGIKCYLREEKTSSLVFVRHSNREKTISMVIDAFDVGNETWHQFKYPLLDNYHTETRIILSDDVESYTLAILNTAHRVRENHGVNYFPSGYKSFDTTVYGSFNKALSYCDGAGPKIYLNAAESIKIYPMQ